jgi:hypothetical protein
MGIKRLLCGRHFRQPAPDRLGPGHLFPDGRLPDAFAIFHSNPATAIDAVAVKTDSCVKVGTLLKK